MLSKLVGRWWRHHLSSLTKTGLKFVCSLQWIEMKHHAVNKHMDNTFMYIYKSGRLYIGV